LRKLLIIAGIGVILVVIINFKVYKVSGNSMSPEFMAGDYIIVNKNLFIGKGYELGQVILFSKVTERKKSLYVKRILGDEGDVLKTGEYYLKLNEQIIPHDPVFLTIKNNFENYREVYVEMLFKNISKSYPSSFYVFTDSLIVIPDGFYFLVGDNLYESMDSRFWGFIHEDQILGEVVFSF
jgi:signal peptidase I